MNASLRACIASAAARAVGQSVKSAVFDYSQGKHIQIGGSSDASNVSLFDHSRSAHVKGTLPKLFDYGTSSHITLQVSGTSFRGFDYGSSSHYSGSVRSGSVTIFDYETSQHHQYSV